MRNAQAVRFEILGPLTALRADEVVDLGSPKQRAILALLLIHANTPMAPDRIIDALWGEKPPPSATASLQAYISNLRKALEPDRPARTPSRLLVKNGGGYQMALERNQLDALAFSSLVEEAGRAAGADPDRALSLLRRALGLWHGPALADFQYAEFARTESTRLEELRIVATELRIKIELDIGRSDDLVPELETLVKANPYREKLWGNLMVALYRAGRQADALRAYRRCEEALAEIGISPGEALRKLEMSVLDQDPELLSSPLAQTNEIESARSESAGLIGRDTQLAIFRRLLKEARLEKGSVLLLEGEAGIGKTRLMETLKLEAQEAGFVTAFARCVEVGGTPPFWPWMQISRKLGTEKLTSAAGAGASKIHALLLAGNPDAGPTTSLYQVADGLAAALTTMAREKPIALFIDDLYSADPDSLHLLTLLSAEIEQSSVVIVGSHRGHATPRSQPLTSTLSQLNRFDWVQRLSLPPLNSSEIAKLTASTIGGRVDEKTSEAIFARSEGNAFFAVELTRLLQDEDALSEMAATAIPASILEVVSRRTSALSPSTLDLVRCGALLGRSFDARLAGNVLGYDGNTVVSAVESAIEAGLIEETSDPNIYRFSHMIVVDGITQTLGGLRRAQLHSVIADSLERQFGTDPAKWVAIAHHRVHATPINGEVGAIHALARAGDYALRSSAIQLAEELFGQRHSLVESLPASEQRDALEIDALFDLGRVWTWQEGFHSPRLRKASVRLWELTGIESGDAGFDQNRPIDSMNPVLASYQARFSVEIVSGDVNTALAIGDSLLSLSEQNPDPMVVYAANQTALTALIHAGEIQAATAAAQKAYEALRALDPRHGNDLMLPMGQQPAWITYHTFAAWLNWLLGDSSGASQELALARELCERSQNPFFAGFCATIEGIVGAMDQSPHTVFQAQAWSRTVSDVEIVGVIGAWLSLHRCWAEGMTGSDPSSAAAEMKERIEQLEYDGARVAHSLYWGLTAEVALRAGLLDLAQEAALRGIAHSQRSGERFWYPELERLLSEALRSAGQASAAEIALEKGRAAARDLDIVPLSQRAGIALSS